ncbi:TIGR02234 family membrane protein [Rhodococcus sp. MEB064]|uniref:TIGR02234 family membrane protein n=1 Tax=Rhodococcus sp. MEB064 TaxID=1587522 RepID=UPI0005AC2E9A|nr:TIGR02234 family membrane protein [Rhodococcus sp. MEB064]KIQ19659.1 hypothetical protein RU01_04655 [Rhodococcus sp. MEB064]
MRGGRSTVGISAVLLALAALALWASSRMTWVTVVSSDGLGEQQTTRLVGGTWAAATTPLAIAAIAAVAALFAIRGRWTVVLAGLIALVAVAAAIPSVQLLVSGATADRAGSLAELPGRAEVISAEANRAPAALAFAGALLALAAAVTVARSARSTRGLSDRYDSPAVRRDRAEQTVLADPDDPAEEPSERAIWDALDSGLDPTLDRERRSGEGRSENGETR